MNPAAALMPAIAGIQKVENVGLNVNGVILLILTAVVVPIAVIALKYIPEISKVRNAREGNLLKERATEMVRMSARIAQLEAEQRTDRHTLSNLEQCLDALLMMIEINPERAQDAAAKIKVMRTEMKAREATEKGAVLAATITAAGVEGDPS